MPNPSESRTHDELTPNEQAASDREQAIQNAEDGQMSQCEIDAERLQDACDLIHQDSFDDDLNERRINSLIEQL